MSGAAGCLPEGATAAQTAWYLMAEMGIWPFREPLFALKPELGQEILNLCRTLRPSRIALLEALLQKEC